MNTIRLCPITLCQPVTEQGRWTKKGKGISLLPSAKHEKQTSALGFLEDITKCEFFPDCCVTWLKYTEYTLPCLGLGNESRVSGFCFCVCGSL